jgi:hypothetical protein
MVEGGGHGSGANDSGVEPTNFGRYRVHTSTPRGKARTARSCLSSSQQEFYFYFLERKGEKKKIGVKERTLPRLDALPLIKAFCSQGVPCSVTLHIKRIVPRGRA